jgi:putative membrane protein
VSEIDVEPDRRLHPLSWVFALVSFARQFVVPLAAIVFFGARNDGSLWGLVLLGPLLIAALWRQLSFRYGFESDSLVIREGWLFRNVRRIQYRRIENIDTERGPLHRLLNVAEVRVESSTGGKAEGLMRVLSLEAVDELRERIFDERSRDVSNETRAVERETSQVLLHLPAGELLRYGLIDNRGVVLIVAFVGLLLQSNIIDSSQESLTYRYMELIGWSPTGVSILALVGTAAGVLLLLTRLLSIAWAVVTLYDFTLAKQASDLRVSYGLLTRVALTLRLPRVQAVRQTQSLLHRLFDRVAISVDMAGDGFDPQRQQEAHANTRVRWLAPICTPDDASEIIHAALPMIDPATAFDWRALAPGARARIFRKTLAFIAILGISAVAMLLSWLRLPPVMSVLVVPVLAPLAWWRAATYTNHTRWALTRDALMFRSGWLTRRWFIVPRNRVQSVKIGVSPFDRRKRMGKLTVDTAGAGGAHGPLRIPYLDFETAERLAQALYRFEGEWSETDHRALNAE